VTVRIGDVLDISLEKTASPTEIVAGEDVTYSFAVTNNGNVPVSNVMISDTSFDPPLSFYCHGDARADEVLAPGATDVCDSITLPITDGMFDADDKFVNTAVASAVPEDYADPIESAESQATVTLKPPPPPQASIELEKTADPTAVKAGESVNYSFTVTNTGEVPLTQIQINDPGYGTFYCYESDPDFVLNPGEQATCDPLGLQLDADRFDDDGEYVNKAQALAIPVGADDPIESEFDAATVTLIPFEPGISLTKSASPTLIKPGDQVTYTFTVTNTGEVPLTHVQIHDTEFGPAGTFYCKGAANQTDVLAVGASITCDTLKVPIDASRFGPTTEFTNEATASAIPAGATALIESDPATATVHQLLVGSDIKAITYMNVTLHDLWVIGKVGMHNRDLLDSLGIDLTTCTVTYTTPTHGVVNKNATTEWLFDYVPAHNFVGTDKFEYTITCGTITLAGTYTVVVLPLQNEEAQTGGSIVTNQTPAIMAVSLLVAMSAGFVLLRRRFQV